MKATQGEELSKLIKKAISDLKITMSEYDEILAQVYADGRVDPEEQNLLDQLNAMIADGTVKRVPD